MITDTDDETTAPTIPAAVVSVFLFPNGAIACLDADGQQVCAWQRNLFCDYLRLLRAAGVVTGATRVETLGLGARENTVARWIGDET